MTRNGKKLPVDVIERIRPAVARVAKDNSVAAIYLFGSLAEGKLKPLSNIDFDVLLSYSFDKQRRFNKSIELLGILNETLKTDEVDLLVLNDDPLRVS